MKFLTEPVRQIPIVAEKDVVVVGGGVAGVMAAVAAARAGAQTLIAERNGYFGGAAAMWLPIQGFVDCTGRQIVQGLGQEFIERMRAKGGAGETFTPCEMHNPFLVIDSEIAKLVFLEMLEEAGVELYLQTWTTAVQATNGHLYSVIVENKSGREAFTAKTFVDASGDGDVAAWSGAPFTVGRPEDSIPQSATLTFRLDGVDTEFLRHKILENPERYDLYMMPHQQFRTNRRFHIVSGLKNLVDQARAEGYAGVPVEMVNYCTLLEPGAINVNMTKVHRVRGHDARELTRAEVESRKQVPLIVEFLKRYVPGFANARLTSTPGQVGIRETRHIEGDYILDDDDVLSGRRFPDTIAVGGYPIDIHNTRGEVRLTKIPPYGIPYRCLTPKGLDNVLVAGRNFSATHKALGTARVMSTCMAMGQAAGEAAAWSMREECSVHNVDVTDLQARLRANGAYLLDDQRDADTPAHFKIEETIQ